MNCPEVYSTRRILLRPWEMEDVVSAFEIYSDPEVVRGLSMEPIKDLAAQEEWLARMIERDRNYGPRFGVWAMVLRESMKPVGTLLLKPLPNSEKIEVGWHLAQSAWGYGYATEGGQWALARAFNDLELEEVFAVAFEWNVRSTSVMERLNMTKIGLTSEYYDQELVQYRISREEYVNTQIC